jgi:hypothetical protein
MPALNFQPRFAPLVESGEKRQTIRAERKRPIRAGQTLYLNTWTGSPFRSKVRRLRTAMCCEALPISIIVGRRESAVYVDGSRLLEQERRELAEAEGFEDCGEMYRWFEEVHGLCAGNPFHGQVIRW